VTDPIYPEDHVWLARVRWVRRGDGTPYGGVTPVARRDDSTGAWAEISAHDAAVTFPDQGSAFWFDVPAGIEEDDLVLVRVAPQTRPEPGKDAYHVAWWTTAYEVVDLRPWEDPRSQRAALTGEGLALRLATPNVYLRLEDEEAVGPVTLERLPDGRWRLADEHADDLKVVRLLDAHGGPVRVGDHRAQILLDRDEVGPPTRYVNWASDRKLAEGIFKRLLSLDRKAAEALPVTKATYKQYLDAYPGFDLGTEHLRRQEAARFERVEELLSVVEADEELVRRAAEALLGHPAVADALDETKGAAVEAAVRSAEATLRAEAEGRRQALEDEIAGERERLEGDLVEARADLAAATDRKAEIEAEIEALQARLDALQADADEQAAAVERALDARLAELAAKPAEAFAELAIVRALAAPPGASVAPQGSPRHLEPTPTEGADAAVGVVESLRVASGSVRMRLVTEDHLVGAALLAAFATHRAVVVAGDGGPTALRAVAEVVAGGRMTWIPVPPTLTDPAGLLTTSDPSTGRPAPHPGGLLAAAERAAADGRLALVVLDGFDRAPSDHYLDPLLQCYADAGRSRTARTLPYVGLDGTPQRLAWPRNLLLACVPSGGPSALPPGPTFWKHAVLVDVGGAGDAPVMAGVKYDPDLREIDLDAWASAVDAVSPSPHDLPDLTGSLDAPAVAVRSAAALYRAALAFNVPEADARRIAFVGAVLPHAPDEDAGADAVAKAVPQAHAPRALQLLTQLLTP